MGDKSPIYHSVLAPRKLWKKKKENAAAFSWEGTGSQELRSRTHTREAFWKKLLLTPQKLYYTAYAYPFTVRRGRLLEKCPFESLKTLQNGRGVGDVAPYN